MCSRKFTIPGNKTFESDIFSNSEMFTYGATEALAAVFWEEDEGLDQTIVVLSLGSTYFLYIQLFKAYYNNFFTTWQECHFRRWK